VNHWKNIRVLVSVDDPSKARAFIQRGRRPNEYTIVFPADAYIWSMKYHMRDRRKITNPIPDYVLTDSSLAIAKTVGLLIAQGLA